MWYRGKYYSYWWARFYVRMTIAKYIGLAILLQFAFHWWYISVCFIVILLMLEKEKEKMLKPYRDLQEKFDRIVNDYELLASLIDREEMNGLQMIIEELTNNIEKMESYKNTMEQARKENKLHIDDSSYGHHSRMADTYIKKMESARCDAYRRMYKLEYEAKKGNLR